MDIAAFLTARLDEDERGAHAACGFHDFKPYRAAKSLPYNWRAYVNPGAEVVHGSGELAATARAPEVAAHIARHDPARVLREVAAKRRVLARHHDDGDGCYGCGFGSDEERMVKDVNDCPELRDMASIYTDHPDHDPAWSVEHSA